MYNIHTLYYSITTTLVHILTFTFVWNHKMTLALKVQPVRALMFHFLTQPIHIHTVLQCDVSLAHDRHLYLSHP